MVSGHRIASRFCFSHKKRHLFKSSVSGHRIASRGRFLFFKTAHLLELGSVPLALPLRCFLEATLSDITFRVYVAKPQCPPTKHSLSELIPGIPGNGINRAGPDLGSTCGGAKMTVVHTNSIKSWLELGTYLESEIGSVTLILVRGMIMQTLQKVCGSFENVCFKDLWTC